MYIIDIKVRFDEEKAKKVLEKHGVVMEEVRQEILAERFKPELVRNQREPFPNRVYQRRYENGELRI